MTLALSAFLSPRFRVRVRCQTVAVFMCMRCGNFRGEYTGEGPPLCPKCRQEAAVSEGNLSTPRDGLIHAAERWRFVASHAARGEEAVPALASAL
jgi:hypothetical protein